MLNHARRAFFTMTFLIAYSASAEPSPGDSVRTRRWYAPHYLPVQFAGNIGLVSSGIGYSSNKQNYQLSLMYGYVPASIAQSPIHTIAARNIFPLTNYSLRNNQSLIPYVGLGLIAEIGGNAFFRNPSHFPKGYYAFPKNLHVLGFGGVKLKHLFSDDLAVIRGIEFYAEAGTVDAFVWYKAISDQVKLHRIFSLSLGVHLLLDH